MSQKPRVLVVDDFETVRVVFVKCLNELGIDNIVQCENGAEALRLAQEAHAIGHPFDVLFVDWNMPVMNGFELLVAFRKIDHFKDTPYVMVTSNSEETAVVDAVRAGVSEYMVKPFNTEALGRTVEKVLKKVKAKAA
jgi:two-component system chemotaxis response regulator CheY